MNQITKAEEVEQAYDDALAEGESSGTCYDSAVHTALELGGIVIANSNDDNSSKSFAPNITFTFDDGSSAEVAYGGVFSSI